MFECLRLLKRGHQAVQAAVTVSDTARWPPRTWPSHGPEGLPSCAGSVPATHTSFLVSWPCGHRVVALAVTASPGCRSGVTTGRDWDVLPGRFRGARKGVRPGRAATKSHRDGPPLQGAVGTVWATPRGVPAGQRSQSPEARILGVSVSQKSRFWPPEGSALLQGDEGTDHGDRERTKMGP